jgi:hypothetical protein
MQYLEGSCVSICLFIFSVDIQINPLVDQHNMQSLLDITKFLHELGYFQQEMIWSMEQKATTLLIKLFPGYNNIKIHWHKKSLLE